MSLLGIGGIGTTRLAIEVGRELHLGHNFDDGVHLLRTAEGNASAEAQRLGLLAS